MAKPTEAEIAAKRAAISEAREQALQAKADVIRIKARNQAENIRRKADEKAKLIIAKGEAHAAKVEGIVPAEIERTIGIGGRHRTDLPGTRDGPEMGVRGVHDLLVGTVRQFRLLSSG